jgi:hypothetical protein
MCDGARGALAGQRQTGQRSATIDALGEATVARGRGKPFEGASGTALSVYASGGVDAVTARGPLPQYLAAVYGGTVTTRAQATLQPEAAARIVDEIAAAYPEFEPDSLYLALQPSQGR